MSSNTFFGEVNELSSRAIYWSDNESDEDTEESADVIPTDVEVNVSTTDKFSPNYSKIYVSLSKTDKTIAGKDLTSIGSVTGKTNIGGNIADIVAINETSIWLRINSNHPNLKNHLLVQTISCLLNKLFAKLKSSSVDNRPLVLLVSKDFQKDSDDVITYLTSNKDNLSVIPSSLKSSPLLAPKMLNNLIESSVVEYCIVFNVNFISILLPEFQSNDLIIGSFIPKPVTDCVQQFNRFSDNNIYI